eukprot:scaffold28281_cov53-Attheya_sp.AAC.3
MASIQMPAKKAPARQTRRYVAPSTVLERYGATVLLSKDNNKREAEDAAAEPTGISIAGVNIVTRAAPSIGSEQQMDALTQCLEDASNPPNNNNTTTTITTPKQQRRRRVCAPEIVFCDSILSVQYNTKNNQHRPSSPDDEEPGTNNNKEVVKITAEDALLEWAEAHQDLQQQDDGNSNNGEGSSSGEAAYNGVSVLKTADAQLWSQRHAASSSSSFSNANAGCDFYYDWTFSTPFIGGGNSNASWTSGGDHWVETNQSGIDMGLLQDSSQPILYFDELVLYEDDLHDNGDVSLTVKVRVMPTCWFVLQRLYVRVDHVLVRLREVRFFATFSPSSSQTPTTTTTVHRTVTWKECAWDGLLQHDLPAQVSLWRAPPAYPPPSPQQLQTLERFFQRLPTVSQLPKGIPVHSSLTLHNDDDG